MAAAKRFARSRPGCPVANDDVHVFIGSQVADDLGVNPVDGLKFSRPVGAVLRPADPGGCVRFPLGRHTVTKRAGSRGIAKIASIALRTASPDNIGSFGSPGNSGSQSRNL